MATCRVNWLPHKCRCEVGLEETRRTEEVDRTVHMSSHCRWPRQRGRQETDKLLNWSTRWLKYEQNHSLQHAYWAWICYITTKERLQRNLSP